MTCSPSFNPSCTSVRPFSVSPIFTTPAGKLVCIGLHVDERLVLRVTKNRRIRNGQCIGQSSGVHVAVTYMSFFSLYCGFCVTMRACNVRVVGIERVRDVRNLSVKRVGIRVRRDFDVVADADIRHVALVDVDEHPHGAHVGNCVALRRAGLQKLTGSDQQFGDLSADRRRHRNLSRIFRRLFHQRFRIANAESAQPVGGGFLIGECLRAIRFRLLQIALGDGFVLEQILWRVRNFCRRVETRSPLSDRPNVPLSNRGWSPSAAFVPRARFVRAAR